MTDFEKSYGLLTELSGIEETRNPARQRHLRASDSFRWLRLGLYDFMIRPWLSVAYGLAMTATSAFLIWLLFTLALDYIMFPALAGFMIVGPVLAVGLYEKSRAIERGERPTLRRMLSVQPRAGAHIFFTGLLLCLVMLLWMRAAVLIYALFFGIRPFPGLDRIAYVLLTTPEGYGLAIIGTLVGGLFAAFSFAISALSIPMLLDQRVDALTAMATSMATVWNNLTPMLMWGVIVLALFAFSIMTGLFGLIVVFPLLGHATWHAYKALC